MEDTDKGAHVWEHNSRSWDVEARSQGPWSQPVGPDVIRRARQQDWELRLAGDTPVPRAWFPASLKGVRTLVLAGGGGQQAAVLAAAGAEVTVLDNSVEQLSRDRLVAEREGLNIKTQKGVMEDLSCFKASSFELVVHPCSNCFVPDVKPVWMECSRVLRRGGRLLAGFFNPIFYTLDKEKDEAGEVSLKYAVPYSDLTSIEEGERLRLIEVGAKVPHLEFGHSLQDQIGGQLEAGLHLTGFLDSRWEGATTLDRYVPVYILTCAIQP